MIDNLIGKQVVVFLVGSIAGRFEGGLSQSAQGYEVDSENGFVMFYEDSITKVDGNIIYLKQENK